MDIHALFHASPFTGYVYPNETVVPWSILIVIYPYMTGLVAGAFTVSSLYHVFGIERFKTVSRFALITALCFMVFVPVTLLSHLGHPERAFNAMITPHTTSAMAVFGYVAAFYVCLLALEIWFIFREDIVAGAKAASGWKRHIYRVLTLGSYEVNETTRHYDHKWTMALAIIGIPAAHGLHGYVGFLFGSVKAREWWSSDLMPVIFLFSAVISGVAVMIVLYAIVARIRKMKIDESAIKGLMLTLWAFLMFTVLLELVEFGAMAYRAREGTEVIMEYVSHGPMFWRFAVIQIGLGAFVPVIIMSLMVLRGTSGKALLVGTLVSAVLVLISVLFMRYNVVIGGQEISKSMKGIVHYEPPLWGREGLLVAGLILMAPLGLYYLLTRIFDPWHIKTHADDPVTY
ncbi:MAG: polysulfide reductase NrfD [Betaproteobacteria bacterium]|nr:polysulfide reductase NrfD [Betaproteobacteria bacterium]